MKILRYIFFGSLLGAVVSGWFSKEMISWWWSPPVDIALNCRGAVEWGIDAYRKFMITGAVLGAVFGFLALFIVNKRKPMPPGSSPSSEVASAMK